jgi:regulation of enolase protein 1 (concanavalin A-like superfamily)
MLRGGLGADAAHVLLDVKPDGGVEFMTRSATGGSTTYIAGATASFPVWLRLTYKGSAVTALISSDARSWQTVGTTTLDTSGSSWRRTLGGFAVTSHDNATTAQAVFQEPSVGLDWPWTQADIGAMTRFDANAEFVDLSYIVSGTGADIWGTADAFHFMYQPHQSDGLIVARIDSEQNTNPFAKAGLMIRDATGGDTGAGAKNVVLDVRPNGAVEFMARTATGGSTAYLGGTTRAFPVWLKLERHGDTITGFTSADGSAWASVGSIDVAIGTIPNFGVAVTSHDTSTINTAIIGTLFIQSTAPDAPPPPPAPSNFVVYASDIPASAMHGVWAPRSDATSPNGIKLSTPAGSPANTSAPLAAPVDYVDVPFTSATNTRYTLWIRVRATNDSKLSDSLWVQFSDAIANGTPVYPVGTTSGLLVNLATDGTASSLHNWGWVDGAYWLSQPATYTFSNTTGTLRIQPREYGVEIDQIVLSPGTYMNPNASCPTSCAFAPGPINNDTTTVPKP